MADAGSRARGRLPALVADLGGEGALSHQQRSLRKRAIWIELMVEDEEARIAAGGGVDIAPHTQLVGGLLAIYKALGLKRQCGVPPVPWTVYGLGFKPCIAVVAGSVVGHILLS